MDTNIDILIVAGCSGEKPEPGFWDTLAFARALDGGDNASPTVALLGEGHALATAARAVAREGVDVLAISGDGLVTYTCEAYCRVLTAEIQPLQPAYVCTPHTSRGMEWAPRLAAQLGADCIGGIDAVELTEEGPYFLKDLYGGKVKGRFAPAGGTTFLTIQPGAFRYQPVESVAPGRLLSKRIQVDGGCLATEHLATLPAPGDSGALTEARTIVAAGNGIGSEENLALIHSLADCFPHAAVAGTRIVCDRGWLAYDRQVGVTGVTVAPALYIACGISGATQHRVGMRGSRFVVAVNSDPNAPIFNEADLCVVEDLESFIPLLVSLLEDSSAQ